MTWSQSLWVCLKQPVIPFQMLRDNMYIKISSSLPTLSHSLRRFHRLWNTRKPCTCGAGKLKPRRKNWLSQEFKTGSQNQQGIESGAPFSNSSLLLYCFLMTVVTFTNLTFLIVLGQVCLNPGESIQQKHLNKSAFWTWHTVAQDLQGFYL